MKLKKLKRLNSRVTVQSVAEFLEKKAPLQFAEPYDHVGLLSGDPKTRVTQALVANDLTHENVAAAAKARAQLIIVHHPPIFPGPGISGSGSSYSGASSSGPRGLFRIVFDERAPLIVSALQKKIAVYALHTNFDRCAGEVPLRVSKALGCEIEGRLSTGSSVERLQKLVVFVPKSHHQKIQDALFEAGAGRIGHYDSCSFAIEGHGTFRGDSKTHPFLGRPRELERADEIRFETIFPHYLKTKVLSALRAAHPYEEIAYDLYALELAAPKLSYSPYGIGFFGNFSRALSFSELARRVKRAFSVRAFRLTGELRGQIRRVAFSPGSGKGLLSSVRDAGADVFVTGEVDYHQALEAKRAGIALIEVGHVESECFFQPVVRNWLTDLPIGVKQWSRREQKTV